MIRVVMDTSSLISLELVESLNSVMKEVKISIPTAVKEELEEISRHNDKKGGAAKNVISKMSKDIALLNVNDSKRVAELLSKDVNRGEAECFICCVENGIKALVMDDMNAAYRLEGHAIANGIKIRTSVAALLHVQRKNIISKDELKNKIHELIKIREWEGGALEVLANKYLGDEEKKPDIMQSAGIFKDSSEKWEEIQKEIYSTRRKAKMRKESDLTPISGLIKTKETGQHFKDMVRKGWETGRKRKNKKGAGKL